MGLASTRTAVVLSLAIAAASCGTVAEISGSTLPVDADNGTTVPAAVALDGAKSADETAVPDGQAEGGLGATTTEGPDTTDIAADTIEADPDPTDTTAPPETTSAAEPTTSTTLAAETTAPPAARQAADRIVSVADFESNGIAISSDRSIAESAAPQGDTCGVPDPIPSGRLTQVFETPAGTLIAQFVQEGAEASDQWMAALAAMVGCNDPGVSPMRLDPGTAAGSDETLVLASNGSDEDGGYMAAVAGRKGNLVTGFITVTNDPADAALSTEALVKLLELAIAG